MNTKVISFLGTSVRPTIYAYQGQTYEGGVFQIALRQFMPFDQMLVFVTSEARKQAYPILEELNDPRILPVDIRTGRTSEGLWQIFRSVVQHVDPNDKVIFDITHGLRSIPFLTFLAAAYLRSAKHIRIEAVLYGAFDLGWGGPAPVIDLSEFVSLLDWMTATNEFIKTGSASALAEELGKIDDPALQPLAETVEEIATGLHLLRPAETSRAAAKLPDSLTAAGAKLPPPFTLLADTLLQSYSRFGRVESPAPHTQLMYHLEMMNWHHERGQTVHALSLAREWVVSFLCSHFGLDLYDHQARNEMEFLVGGGKLKDKLTKAVIRVSPYLDQWSTVPEGKRLRRLWVTGGGYELTVLRNDVLHSGFRKNPKSSDDVLAAANNVLTELNEIARALGLSGPDKTKQPGDNHDPHQPLPPADGAAAAGDRAEN